MDTQNIELMFHPCHLFWSSLEFFKSEDRKSGKTNNRPSDTQMKSELSSSQKFFKGSRWWTQTGKWDTFWLGMKTKQNLKRDKIIFIEIINSPLSVGWMSKLKHIYRKMEELLSCFMVRITIIHALKLFFWSYHFFSIGKIEL